MPLKDDTPGDPPDSPDRQDRLHAHAIGHRNGPSYSTAVVCTSDVQRTHTVTRTVATETTTLEPLTRTRTEYTTETETVRVTHHSVTTVTVVTTRTATTSTTASITTSWSTIAGPVPTACGADNGSAREAGFPRRGTRPHVGLHHVFGRNPPKRAA